MQVHLWVDGLSYEVSFQISHDDVRDWRCMPVSEVRPVKQEDLELISIFHLVGPLCELFLPTFAV